MSRQIDPQAKELLDSWYEQKMPPRDTLSVSEMRSLLEERLESDEDPVSVGDVTNLTITGPGGDLPLRIYTPGSRYPYPMVVFFHGGGWVLGGLDSHDDLCRRLATTGGFIVVSVGYRLAPEHKFPAAVNDAYTALSWVADQASYLGGDPEHLVVAGDSAGGALATVSAMLARDRGGPDLDHQVLLYPVTNYVREMPSYEENAEYLAIQDPSWYKDLYIDDPVHRRNPYAFPLETRNLDGLPPATVLTCEFDRLRDEGIEYANRLDDAGIDTDIVHYDQMIHGFLTKTDQIDRARNGIRDVAERIAAKAP